MTKQKDMSQKLLEGYNDVFADIVNVLLFDGEEVVKENELLESVIRSQYKVAYKYHEQERDVAKFWHDVGVRIACIGIENQTNSDKSMPMRVLSYDAASYREQLLKKDDENQNNKKPIYPVVTLVLHFNHKERWKAPRSLLESLDILPDSLKDIVNDYRINVFEIAFLPREIIDKFKSDFWIVADYFWQLRNTPDYKPSKKKIRHVQAVLQSMSAFTGDKRFEEVYNEENEGMIGKNRQGGEHTMESFLDKIEERGRQEGRLKGRQEGRREGRQEGHQEGFSEGRNEGVNIFIQASEDDGKTPEVIIADLKKYFKLTEAEAKRYYDKYSAMQPA